MCHLDFLFLPSPNHSHPPSQSLFQTVLQRFFLLCLQRKSVAFYSAAKILYALTTIKLDWNPLLFVSTQTDKSSTPYDKCLKKGCGMNLLDEPLLKIIAESTVKPKSSHDQNPIPSAAEQWAPCSSWLPELGWHCSAVTLTHKRMFC